MQQGIFDRSPTAEGQALPFAAAFCRGTLPAELTARRQTLAARRAALPGGLPRPLAVLRTLLWAAAGLFFCSWLAADGRYAPPLWLALGLAVPALALTLLAARRKARAGNSPAALQLAGKEQALDAAVDAALGIPAGAVRMDVLCRAWQPGDEARGSIVALGDYVNLEARVWAAEGRLWLALADGVYALAPAGELQKQDQKLLLPNWHKPTPPHAAPWHLSSGGGGVYVRPFWVLALADSGCVLAVPGYEEATLRALLTACQPPRAE